MSPIRTHSACKPMLILEDTSLYPAKQFNTHSTFSRFPVSKKGLGLQSMMKKGQTETPANVSTAVGATSLIDSRVTIFSYLCCPSQEQSIFPAAESPSTTVLSSATIANSAAGQGTREWKVPSVGNEFFYLIFKSEK